MKIQDCFKIQNQVIEGDKLQSINDPRKTKNVEQSDIKQSCESQNDEQKIYGVVASDNEFRKIDDGNSSHGSDSCSSDGFSNDKNMVKKMKSTSTDDHVVNFKNLLEEVNDMDFKVIQINSERLGQLLGNFVASGSLTHKLTPDDLTIVANLDGMYPNKEVNKVRVIDDKTVPDTMSGLLANGTKLFDAILYLGMEHNRRPTPSITHHTRRRIYRSANI